MTLSILNQALVVASILQNLSFDCILLRDCFRRVGRSVVGRRGRTMVKQFRIYVHTIDIIFLNRSHALCMFNLVNMQFKYARHLEFV